MPDQAKIDHILLRLDVSREALTTFMRIAEEFMAIRDTTIEGPARIRIDDLIRSNNETMAAVKRSMTIAEDALEREERRSVLCSCLADCLPRAAP